MIVFSLSKPRQITIINMIRITIGAFMLSSLPGCYNSHANVAEWSGNVLSQIKG